MQPAKPKGMTGDELDELAINTIRTLSIDAVQQAETGHPRTPMALAPLVHVLWNEALGGTRTHGVAALSVLASRRMTRKRDDDARQAGSGYRS
jgi:Transketolase, thiamine diphosphate binding domain